MPRQYVAALVGDSPGPEEVQQGVPFVGQAGQELDRELALVGLARGKLALVNAVCCMPPPGASDAAKTKATRCCSAVFARQLPPAIPALTMGKQATFAFMLATSKATKALSIKQARGFLRSTPSGQPFIVTWHPTFAFFHSPFNWGTFSADLANFAKLVRGAVPAELKVTTIKTAAALKKLHAYLRTQPHVAVDIETSARSREEPWTGKQPKYARMRSIAFGTSTEAWALLWNSHALRLGVKKILEDPAVLKVWHNGHYFDLRVLRKHGIKPVNNMDTREMRKALCATSELSLRYLASITGLYPPWKENEDEK